MAESKLNVVDLVELQFIENAISAGHSEIEAEKNSIELEQAEKALEQSRKNLEEMEKSYHDLGTKRKKLEDTLDLQTEKIKTDEKKLFSGTITDAKEMKNYQEEIDILKKKNSGLEDEILEIMEAQDEAEPGLKKARENKDRDESVVGRIKGEIGEKLEVLKNHLEGLQKRRQDVQSRIPDEYLTDYNRLKSKKGGIAVTVLKDNFCSVCNMEIPSMHTERIVEHDKIYRCPLCGRMLVIFRDDMERIKKELE